LASSVSAVGAVIGSALGLAALQQSQPAVGAIVASPVALPVVKAIRSVCQVLGQQQVSNQAFEPGFQWTSRGLPVTAVISQIAYSGTLYVATTTVAGVIWTSPDLVTWTQRTVPAPANAVVYGKIMFANNQFMVLPVGAMSATAPILTSPDGMTWSAYVTGATFTATGLAFGAGKWLMTGNAGNYYTSPNGAVWTAQTGTVNYTAVAFGAGLFVATPASDVRVYTSPDGVAWTSVTIPTSGAYQVLWNGTIFLLYSTGALNTITSTNGTAWASGLGFNTNPTGGVVWANGVWLMHLNASGNFYTSTNPVAGGVAWSLSAVPGSATSGTICAAGNTFFFTETTTAPDITYSSANGTAWSVVFTPTATLTAGAQLRYGNGNWVISQAGSVAGYLVSSDAVNWVMKMVPTVTQAVWTIDFLPAANLWIAIDTGSTTYYTSPDLNAWTARTAPIAPAAGGFACGANFALIATATALYTSTDAINWTVGVVPPTGTNYIHSNGVFAALVAGSTTSIYVSLNGTTWMQLSGLTSATYTQFCSNGAGVYIVASGGTSLISTNYGASWTSPVSVGMAVTYANGLFVAIAGSSVLTSTDAQNWTPRYAANTTTYNGNQIAFGGGIYAGLCNAATQWLTNFA
jgi:hypothetical protein